MKLMIAMAGIWRRLAKLMRQRQTRLPKDISDNIARDIGMHDAELERHRFVWPSESKDRPLL